MKAGRGRPTPRPRPRACHEDPSAGDHRKRPGLPHRRREVVACRGPSNVQPAPKNSGSPFSVAEAGDPWHRAVVRASDEGFVPLFNGRDVTGWFATPRTYGTRPRRRVLVEISDVGQFGVVKTCLAMAMAAIALGQPA